MFKGYLKISSQRHGPEVDTDEHTDKLNEDIFPSPNALAFLSLI